jgi:hypothetical protein
MKTRRVGFVFVVFLSLGIGTVLGNGQTARPNPHNGFWQVSQSEEFKLGFSTGYGIAMNNANDRAILMCLAEKKGDAKNPQALRDTLTACAHERTAVLFDFNNLTVGQLAGGADEFYKDFRNKNIEITPVMFYVRDELKGKPAKELEDELNLFRHGPTPAKQ